MQKPSRHIQSQPAAALILLVLASSSLTGCSNPGATTCDEYAAQPLNERSETLEALLIAHDLEPNAMGNALGIVEAVNSFCGLNGISDEEPAAGQNGSSPIENAVDWSAPTW